MKSNRTKWILLLGILFVLLGACHVSAEGNVGKVEGVLEECAYLDGELQVDVWLESAPENCIAILAVYADNGALLETETKLVQKGDQSICFTKAVGENYCGEKVKVFFWNSLEGMQPAGSILSGKVVRKNIAVFIGSYIGFGEKGNRVSCLNFYQNGKEKWLYAEELGNLNFLQKGDLFEYKTNRNGKVELDSIVNITERLFSEAKSGDVSWTYAEPVSDDEITYVFGQVYERKGSAFTLGSIRSGERQTYNVHENAEFYLVDFSYTKPYVEKSDFRNVQACRYTKDGILDEYLDNFMVCLAFNRGIPFGGIVYQNVMKMNADNTGIVLKR